MLRPRAESSNAFVQRVGKQEVVRIAQERRYNLQETLVHALFQRIAAYRGVKAIRIRSIKPDVYPDAKGVGVEVSSFTGETL
jgi:dihydroneopterin aldolase